MTLPHDWSIRHQFDKTAPAGGAGGYLPTGKGWYRRTLTLGKAYADKKVRLYFEGVYMNSHVYVTVDYFVRTADPKLAAGFSEVKQVITNKVSLASLNPNKYYTIIIHLGLTSVKFEAVVADWATSDNGTWSGNGTYTPGTGATENTQSI